MKRLKYLLFIMLLMPLFVNAQTYTYSVCKNGCEYSELSDLLGFLDSKDHNFNNDDITINITDTASYEINSHAVNFTDDYNNDIENMSNINTLTINGNNAEIIMNEGNRLNLAANTINIKNFKIKDSWIEEIDENFSGNLAVIGLLADKIKIEDSELSLINTAQQTNELEIKNSIITSIQGPTKNDVKLLHVKSQSIGLSCYGNIEFKNIETKTLYINADAGENTANIDFDNVNISNLAVLGYSEGTINNSNIKGIEVADSQLDIKNSAGKILNVSMSRDSIVNVYNPKDMELTYSKVTDMTKLGEIFKTGNNDDALKPDNWLYNYIDVNTGDKDAKINIFVDKKLSIKTNTDSDIKSLLGIDNISDLTFAIEDESIAKISEDKITGLKEGTTKITATREDGVVTYTINLTVEKESIPEKIDKMTIKVPITGKEVKMWIIAVSVILLSVIGVSTSILIKNKKKEAKK